MSCPNQSRKLSAIMYVRHLGSWVSLHASELTVGWRSALKRYERGVMLLCVS
jgi:hypothetical protein